MNAQRALRPIEVLMVEDNPGDVRLTREALRGGKIWNEIHVVMDGVAALDFLYRKPAAQQQLLAEAGLAAPQVAKAA